MERKINIPIKRLYEARTKPERFRAFAAAVIIKERYANSTLYSDGNMTKALVRCLGCSYPVARKVENDLLKFGYCVKTYNRARGCWALYVRTFRSREKIDYSQSDRTYKPTEHDIVYKLTYEGGEYDKDNKNKHSLMTMRRLLREVLLENAIHVAQRAALSGTTTENSVRETVDGVAIKTHSLAAHAGLSRSSVSRYTSRMRDKGVVGKTGTIVAEVVVPVLNAITERQWLENNEGGERLYAIHDIKHGAWIGVVYHGKRYRISDGVEERKFQHLLWRHKKHTASREKSKKRTSNTCFPKEETPNRYWDNMN